jgi:hypothetical protein
MGGLVGVGENQADSQADQKHSNYSRDGGGITKTEPLERVPLQTPTFG